MYCLTWLICQPPPRLPHPKSHKINARNFVPLSALFYWKTLSSGMVIHLFPSHCGAFLRRLYLKIHSTFPTRPSGTKIFYFSTFHHPVRPVHNLKLITGARVPSILPPFPTCKDFLFPQITLCVPPLPQYPMSPALDGPGWEGGHLFSNSARRLPFPKKPFPPSGTNTFATP